MGRYKELLFNMGLFAISSVSTKLISFVLVPLYTFYLSTSEYGVMDMSVVVISLMAPVCTISFCCFTVVKFFYLWWARSL